MQGMSGPCPQCAETITAPGAQKVVKSKEAHAATQYFREDNPSSERLEHTPLQIEVYEEKERSPHILPGLLPTRIGDVILPAFRVIRPGPRWLMLTRHVIIIFAAVSPFLWLASFYLPETRQLWAEFNAYRVKQLDFVERQIHSSQEAQSLLDKQAKVASSRPEKPVARAARQAVAQNSAPPPAPPATAASRPLPPPPARPSASSGAVTSLASAPMDRARPAAATMSSALPASVSPQAPPPASSPYEAPPADREHEAPLPPFGNHQEATEEWPQILLRNNGIFAGHTPARGTCSFLVEGDNGTCWLATASPLLGEEGGVRPPVAAARLSAELYLWRAYFPGDESSFVDAVGGSSLVSVANAGWLAMKLTTTPALLPASPVRLRHNPPAAGETVYLVGLPNDDLTGASQHLYAGQVTSAQQEDPGQFGFTLQVPFKLMGFGGAPIVDVRGEVVGVLTGGHTSLLIGTKADALEAMIRGK
ncbi:MAG: Dipeptidyl aminopeptidase/acylaminoacyl-peptidase-like protein [Verrucomicrobiaceae bacterium]|nr:Dipeptidyl aminopeptidase/acylaminoacyl-peptidase-like protein [Verrucomicrobiaceae bacterium]